MMEQIELIGNGIRLIPLERSHVDVLFAAGQDSRIWTYLPRVATTREQMEALVADALAAKQAGTQHPYIVMDEHLGEVVGSTRFLNIASHDRNLEIGWTWYTPAVWQTYINTACKYTLLTHCFETLGFVRVQLKADVRNERSNRAIQRIGAVHEGVLRQDRILPDGHVRSANLYSILDSEWPQVKMKFEQQLFKAGK